MLMLFLALPILFFAGVSGYGECARHVLAQQNSLTKTVHDECLLSSNVLSSQYFSHHHNQESQKILTKEFPYKVINEAVPKCLIVAQIGKSLGDTTKSLEAIISCEIKRI